MDVHALIIRYCDPDDLLEWSLTCEDHLLILSNEEVMKFLSKYWELPYTATTYKYIYYLYFRHYFGVNTPELLLVRGGCDPNHAKLWIASVRRACKTGRLTDKAYHALRWHCMYSDNKREDNFFVKCQKAISNVTYWFQDLGRYFRRDDDSGIDYGDSYDDNDDLFVHDSLSTATPCSFSYHSCDDLPIVPCAFSSRTERTVVGGYDEDPSQMVTEDLFSRYKRTVIEDACTTQDCSDSFSFSFSADDCCYNDDSPNMTDLCADLLKEVDLRTGRYEETNTDFVYNFCSTTDGRVKKLRDKLGLTKKKTYYTDLVRCASKGDIEGVRAHHDCKCSSNFDVAVSVAVRRNRYDVVEYFYYNDPKAVVRCITDLINESITDAEPQMLAFLLAMSGGQGDWMLNELLIATCAFDKHKHLEVLIKYTVPRYEFDTTIVMMLIYMCLLHDSERCFNLLCDKFAHKISLWFVKMLLTNTKLSKVHNIINSMRFYSS